MDTAISPADRGSKVASLIEKNAWGVMQEYAKLGRSMEMYLINAFAFVLDDEEPILITGTVADPENHTVELAVFTKSRLLYFKGESRAETPAIQIIPRSSLTELTILSAPLVVSAPRFEGNGRSSYALAYGTIASFNLPIMAWADDDVQQTLDGFLPELFADLNA